MIDYKAAIGYLYLVRERIRKVDHQELFEYYLPKVKTTDDAITEWEEHNDLKLPDSYKEFLLSANGWKYVNQDRDLFSLEDLTLSKESKYIQMRDSSAASLNDVGDKNLLMPVGASQYSDDIYLMVLDKNSESYGQVIWAADEEIERYKDFEEFFLFLIAYNKHFYTSLTGMEYID